MEFVWMKHPDIEQPAQVPETAVSHWSQKGWEEIDPPAPPVRRPRTQPTAPADEAEKPADTAAPAPPAKAVDKSATSTPQK